MPAEDPTRLLREAAQGPVARLDHDVLRRRARHRTARRRLSVVGLGLAAVLSIGLAVANLVGPELPEITDDPEQPGSGACPSDDRDQTVAGIDLDGDGLDDRARLETELRGANRQRTITVCFGDGTTNTVVVNSTVGDWSIEAADLGGHPGIVAVSRVDGTTSRGDRRVGCLLRWVGDEMRWVGGESSLGFFGPDDARCWVERTGSEVEPGIHLRQAWGCRPATSADADFDVADIELVLRESSAGDEAPRLGTLEVLEYFFTFSVIAGEELQNDATVGYTLADDPAPRDPGTGRTLPELTPESDLHQVLRDLGFTPRCLDTADTPTREVVPDVDADGAVHAGACRGGSEELRVAGIDLDGDELDDRARLHAAAGRLTVCTGDGQTHDLPARRDDSWRGLEPVDLGGHPGIALVRAGRDADERSVVFVRWADGEFGFVGARERPPGSPPYRWAHEYEESRPSKFETQILYGCKASTFTRPDTGEEADFEVAQLAFHDVSQRNSSELRVEVYLFVEAMDGLSAGWDVGSQYPVRGDQLDLRQFPDLTPQSDPKQLLRDLGFTPRCLPED